MYSYLDYPVAMERYQDLTKAARAARTARLARMAQDQLSRPLRFLLTISSALIHAGTRLHTYALNQMPRTLQTNQ